MFCAVSQNYQHLYEKNNVCILKRIVQGTQKWHWHSSRPSSLNIMDQNSENTVLINNSRTIKPTLILMLFLSSLDNLL